MDNTVYISWSALLLIFTMLRPPNVTVALALNWEDDPAPALIPAVTVLLATHR